MEADGITLITHMLELQSQLMNLVKLTNGHTFRIDFSYKSAILVA